MRSFIAGAIVSLAVAMASAPGMADPVTIETATGPVSLPAAPQTIAVFDIAAIDTLSALGVEIAGVPRPHYVSYLDDVAAGATPVGTLFEPDYEALALLSPEVIVVGGRTAAQVGALSRIAPAIDMTIWGDDQVAQALARLDAYGRLMGLEDRAAAVRATFEGRLATAKAAVAGKGNALIVLANGPKISAYGAGSRFGWLHRELGLPEAKEGVDAQTHGEAISFEFIAEADPDWLIVIDRGAAVGAGGAGAAETLDNELVSGTRAWRDGHVVYLDPGRLYIAGGGIRSMTGTLEELTEAFGG
ncbi:siderophore ABC transporter substrate-binding protein [Tropicimonas sp.]|uniref:siderophore ABC transporter substrate-binding protein n=1 Tax=Tropicimonas sp. TaxID=2067044 RepID=UPI003A8ABA2D